MYYYSFLRHPPRYSFLNDFWSPSQLVTHRILLLLRKFLQELCALLRLQRYNETTTVTTCISTNAYHRASPMGISRLTQKNVPQQKNITMAQIIINSCIKALSFLIADMLLIHKLLDNVNMDTSSKM